MDPIIYEGAKKEIEKAEIKDTDDSSDNIENN